MEMIGHWCAMPALTYSTCTLNQTTKIVNVDGKEWLVYMHVIVKGKVVVSVEAVEKSLQNKAYNG